MRLLALPWLKQRIKTYATNMCNKAHPNSIQKYTFTHTMCNSSRSSLRANYICTAWMTESADVGGWHHIILGGLVVATASKQILCPFPEVVRRILPAWAIQPTLLVVTQSKTSTCHCKLHEEQQKHDDHVLSDSKVKNHTKTSSANHQQ